MIGLKVTNYSVICFFEMIKKTKFLILLLSLHMSLSLNAQLTRADSLELKVNIATSPNEKFEILKELFTEIQFSDPEKAIRVAHQMKGLSDNLGQEEVLFSHNLVGLSYLNTESIDSAELYFEKTYDLAREANDSGYISKVVNNLAVVMFYQEKYEDGLDFMIRSAEIDRALNDIDGAVASYINIGAIYLMLGNVDSAEIVSMKAIEMSEYSSDFNLKADAYLNMGAIKSKLDDSNEAKTYYLKAIDIYKEYGEYGGVAMAYRNLALAYQDQGMFKIAIEYDRKSLEAAIESNSADNIKSAYKGLSRSYENIGNYEKAYEYHKLYAAWNDTLIERRNHQALLELQHKYDSEQTKKENEILAQQYEIKDLESKETESKLNQSRIIILSSIIGLLLLIGLAFVLYNRNVIKNRANKELHYAYTIIQEKNNDITASIEYASKIQEALLPTRENSSLFRDSFFILNPKDIVSGDFLWYAKVDSKIVFTAADCTGHGVPGAFMSMIGNTFLHEIVNVNRKLQPGEILNELRERVIHALSQDGGIESARKDGMDMALCCLDLENHRLEYAGANNPLYIIRNNELIEIKADKQPVGYMPEREVPFNNHEIELVKDDLIYIFSDGYADQFGGPKGKKFKYKQLKELLLANKEKSMLDQKKILMDAFNDWKGSLEQIDDVCFIGVRV